MTKTIGKAGLDLIKSFEGLKLKAYLCPANVWTIGYGHTKTAKSGVVIDEATATQLLISDVAFAEKAVNRLVQKPLNQNQFDALVSFVFNCGEGAFRSSTLLKKLNSGDYSGAHTEFAKWNRGGGKVLAGLTRRRSAEAALFSKVTP